MTRPQDQAAPSPSSVAHRFGAASGDAVPRTEHVRVTAPDLERRAAMERTRGRLVLVAIGFGVLFAAVIGKLVDATVVNPVKPRIEAQLRKPAPAGCNRRRPPPRFRRRRPT